jgi:type I restriction enzyme S subunit
MSRTHESHLELEPYPATKDSGVKWLGEVPEHWEVRRLGQIGRLSKGNGGTKEDEVADGVPCVRYGDLYTRHRYYIEKAKSCVSEERAVAYTPIRFGDVLFAGSGETIAEIGKSAVNLLDEPACCGGDVIVFRPSINLVPRFLGLAADSPQAAYQKSCMGRGITVMHIYGSELKYLSIALPPPEEQAAIVRYLDHVDRRVRRLVRAKRKLIALLTEQKQAIIHRAVTRGLDPDVPLKDSGVEWLGEVPAHWDRFADRLDAATCGARREIALLREYRTRLIADVVTGKLDVREAAANLPDEIDEIEPTESLDELAENGEPVDDDLDAEAEEAVA